MLHVKLTDGPEILLNDGVVETHALWAICQWFHQGDGQDNVLRVEKTGSKLIVYYSESLTPSEIRSACAEAWRDHLYEFFPACAKLCARGLYGSLMDADRIERPAGYGESAR